MNIQSRVQSPNPQIQGEKFSSYYKEESNFLFDLKEFEKKALNVLKLKLEESILGITHFEKKEQETRKVEALPTECGEEGEKVVKEEEEVFVCLCLFCQAKEIGPLRC